MFTLFVYQNDPMTVASRNGIYCGNQISDMACWWQDKGM